VIYLDLLAEARFLRAAQRRLRASDIFRRSSALNLRFLIALFDLLCALDARRRLAFSLFELVSKLRACCKRSISLSISARILLICIEPPPPLLNPNQTTVPRAFYLLSHAT
jgi:hypothetical protein